MGRGRASVTVNGIARLKRRLEDLPDEIRQALAKGVQKSAEAIAEDVSRNVAVDTSGNELTYNNGSWSTPTSIDSGGMVTTSVSCPASAVAPAPFCVAVDINGRAVIDQNGTWGNPATVNSNVAMTSVSCTSASFCTAVGLSTSGGSLSGDAVSYNGTAWSSPTTVASGSSFLDAVSCSSPSFCAAVGTGFVS